MTLSIDQIIDIVLRKEPDWILKAKKEADVLNVHVNGEGVADYLETIEGFENKKQKQLRQKFATSNRFLFSNLLRPVDKVFSAKGGNTIVSAKSKEKEEQLNEHLSDVRDGLSLKKWVQNIQSNKYYSDPAGIVLYEVKDGKTYPTLKSIHSIKEYESSGRDLEWICFMPEDVKDKNHQIVRLIDDQYDYQLKIIGDNVEIDELNTFKNEWGYVPGFTNSDIPSPCLDYNESPIQELIEIADHYLRSTSVKNIYEFLHGYPKFWQYAPKCQTCNGSGEMGGETCNHCNGTGLDTKTDVSDVLLLAPPTHPDAPIMAPNVAGYVSPDLETWREMREELKWLYKLMNFTLWGTMSEMGENETATAANLDVQPRNDRLNKFADAFEDTMQKMIDITCFFYFQDTVKASKTIGRRFLMEPLDTLWKRYINEKKEGAPQSRLNYLLLQCYQTEFANDITQLAMLQKAVKIEPFPHHTVDQVIKFPITNEMKMRKIYFGEWWKILTDDEIITQTTEQLNKVFDKFLKDEKRIIVQAQNRESGEQSPPNL